MRNRDDAATVQLSKIRVKEPLRRTIERNAERRGISMNGEIEDRLEQAYRDERTLSEDYGARAGAARFICDLIRAGGGSRALVCALSLISLPDARSDPEDLARSTIFDLGFDDTESDPARAAEAARWREHYGAEIAAQLVAAYHRLRAEAEQLLDREPPPADPEIAASWDAILRPIAAEADERLRAVLEERMRRQLARLKQED